MTDQRRFDDPEWDEEQTALDDIVDFDECCAACGVNPRDEESRYCESCKETLND